MIVVLLMFCCCVLLAAAGAGYYYYTTSAKATDTSLAVPTTSTVTTVPSTGPTLSSAPPDTTPAPAPAPSVPSGMIQGKIVKVARTDNRAEYINLLGIDVYDQNGNRITSGITPTIQPAVYNNDPSHFGPQFLIDGIHTETDSSGALRLPHSTNDPSAYHQLDLGQDTVISKIVIWNRTACCSDRINGCSLTVTNAAGTNVLTIPLGDAKATYTFNTPLTNTSTSSTYEVEPITGTMEDTFGLVI
jgi:hypothetical protein